ncbi:MAG: hypothetical protein NUV91_07105 [Candidatus Omnitrophica bacterium]|nr:hypothetical protein [Candidatus Omnitrophota bacterium]
MAKQSSMDFEIQFYEGILQKKPDFLQALIAVGDLYTKKGLYQQGLAVDEKLSRLRPTDPYILYNLACSYSLVGRVDQAYEAIKKAIACGYEDFRFLERDEDLANLLRDPRFGEYFLQIKEQRKNPRSPQNHSTRER